MRSLSAHLRQPEHHGRLPFHSDCPVCRRERLVGVLPSDRLISRRAQAAIAAGVIALSAGAPPVAVAQEPDQTSEGGAAQDAPTGGDPSHNPDFDPGGDSTDLPFDAPPTPQVEAAPDPENDDTGPLDQEPATDVDAPAADPGDQGANGEPQQPSPPASAAPEPPAPPPATPAPPEPPIPAPAAPSTPTADPPTEVVPVITDASAEPPSKSPQGTPKKKRNAPRTGGSREAAQAPAPAQPEQAFTGTPAEPSSAPAAQPPQASPARIELVAHATGDRAQPGDRFHIVRPGESLWSIAADALGDRATTARIARRVNEVWELNHDRIATGDRDLLMVDTRLRLR
jgi:hypothetical protein